MIGETPPSDNVASTLPQVAVAHHGYGCDKREPNVTDNNAHAIVTRLYIRETKTRWQEAVGTYARAPVRSLKPCFSPLSLLPVSRLTSGTPIKQHHVFKHSCTVRKRVFSTATRGAEMVVALSYWHAKQETRFFLSRKKRNRFSSHLGITCSAIVSDTQH
ncbi:hypothetical protein BC835DRAFT_193745 [Cytidiella melzeri]|nr:hypothetical protein BC835DRAFT_193745 [Cytidiella melzeri]